MAKRPQYGVPRRIIKCFITRKKKTSFLNRWSFPHKSYLAQGVRVIALQLLINKITPPVIGFPRPRALKVTGKRGRAMFILKYGFPTQKKLNANSQLVTGTENPPVLDYLLFPYKWIYHQSNAAKMISNHISDFY